MPGLYTRLSAYVPAPSSLPLVSRITSLAERFAQARDFGADELAVPSASSSFHPADTGALELRAMERGLGPISFISSKFAVGLVVMAIAYVPLLRLVSQLDPPADNDALPGPVQSEPDAELSAAAASLGLDRAPRTPKAS